MSSREHQRALCLNNSVVNSSCDGRFVEILRKNGSLTKAGGSEEPLCLNYQDANWLCQRGATRKAPRDRDRDLLGCDRSKRAEGQPMPSVERVSSKKNNQAADHFGRPGAFKAFGERPRSQLTARSFEKLLCINARTANRFGRQGAVKLSVKETEVSSKINGPRIASGGRGLSAAPCEGDRALD